MRMSLDEAIKHAEEVAKEQEELYRLCPASESEIFHCEGTKDCKTLENGKNKGCQKCAEEHRQLAEWLKDYKRLLEQGYILDEIRAEILDEKEYAYADFEQYKINYLGVDAEYVEDELPQDDFRYGMERCVEIIDKYKTESEG